MVDKKITELPVLATVTTDDVFVIVDIGTNTTYQANSNVVINSLVGGTYSTISNAAVLANSIANITQFLANPDMFEETSLYFYMGWDSVNGGWLIRKQVRTNSSFTDATIANNGSYANLAAAWVDRAILTYI